MGMISSVVDSSPTATLVRVRMVVSSSWPKACAAWSACSALGRLATSEARRWKLKISPLGIVGNRSRRKRFSVQEDRRENVREKSLRARESVDVFDFEDGCGIAVLGGADHGEGDLAERTDVVGRDDAQERIEPSEKFERREDVALAGGG